MYTPSAALAYTGGLAGIAMTAGTQALWLTLATAALIGAAGALWRILPRRQA